MIATATLANTKISAVDGTAFFDVGIAGLLTDHIGQEIFVRDPAGKILRGHIKAAGTGETTSAELIAGWNSYASYEIFTINGNGHDIDSAINSAGGGEAYSNRNGAPVGGLVKINKATVGTGTIYLYWRPGDVYGFGAGDLTNRYFTAVHASGAGGVNLYANAACNLAVTMSILDVLTPSATGVTIVSTPGDTAQSWAYKDPTFNYKSAYFDINIVDQIGFDWRQFIVPYIPVRDLDRIIAAETVRSINSGRSKGASVPTRIRGV